MLNSSCARLSFLFGLILAIAPQAAAQQQPPPADPLTAHVDVSDVERFATLWKKTNGHPTAAQIDSEYIQGGGEGVKVYTPLRIKDGANMEQQIAAHHDWYEEALDRCLPWVAADDVQLRSIYLGLRGLMPEKPLPQIYMVIGGANSGGTAAPGAQVIGLEIVCRDAPTPEKFAEELRTFFAHETAHTFQGDIDHSPIGLKEPLLALILNEGSADYVASVVTGASPNLARDQFGAAHDAQIWAQFVKDRAIANAHFKGGFDAVGREVQGHWLYNGGQGKLPGWETDMGYWLGMQIVKAYVEQSADPYAAIREVLAEQDPAEILLKSRYADKFKR
jgi:hypothetical protein